MNKQVKKYLSHIERQLGAVAQGIVSSSRRVIASTCIHSFFLEQRVVSFAAGAVEMLRPQNRVGLGAGHSS